MDLAEYLFRRLYQIGVRSVHGVPGDYILNGLDYIPRAGLTWIGNVNELEAGYAADGYARIKGVSALVTTFGVGELSASNAIAGAYAEHVPIVNIVGAPPKNAQATGKVMHHTLGNGDYGAFKRMSDQITCFVTDLGHTDDNARAIDQAIRECVVQSRPVCIYIPMDFLSEKVDSGSLQEPIDLELPYDMEKGACVVEMVLKELSAAKKPAILVDHGAIRHKALEEIRDLVVKSGLPTFVTPMGKSAVDETLPCFCGVYEGDSSPSNVKKCVESSDFIIGIGIIMSDYNTGGFTNAGIQDALKVLFQGLYVRMHSKDFDDINMSRVLSELTKRIEKQPSWHLELPTTDQTVYADQERAEDVENLTHQWLWPRLSSWLQENDIIIITETGTSNFGISMTKFKHGVVAINQILWGSIGYALGACEGAVVAAKEVELNRTILFIGDGSFQLTVTALSTMLRYKLTPIIFVICNRGYTVERYVHGWEASYNDIKHWNYTVLPRAFDAEDMAQTHQIKTRRELEELFQRKDFSEPSRLQLVELWMPMEDAPVGLKKTGKAVKENMG